jgi:bifunctional enzyme CysN/CysC
MDESRPLQEGRKYVIRHTTRSARTIVKKLQYRLDVNTLHRDNDADRLVLNEIGRIQLRTTLPLMCDEYSRNRSTGGFVLIDETTNRTVGAGMINSAG